MSLLLLLKNWFVDTGATPAPTGPSLPVSARQAVASCYSLRVDLSASARQAVLSAISKTPDIP